MLLTWQPGKTRRRNWHVCPMGTDFSSRALGNMSVSKICRSAGVCAGIHLIITLIVLIERDIPKIEDVVVVDCFRRPVAEVDFHGFGDLCLIGKDVEGFYVAPGRKVERQ